MTASNAFTRTVAHTLRVGEDVFVRIFRYTVAHADAGTIGSHAGHSVVFATSRETLDAMDPETHDFDPLSLVDLADAVRVASVLTDVHEGRNSVLSVADRLNGILIEELDAASLDDDAATAHPRGSGDPIPSNNKGKDSL